jgi:hypothetical protein
MTRVQPDQSKVTNTQEAKGRLHTRQSATADAADKKLKVPALDDPGSLATHQSTASPASPIVHDGAWDPWRQGP